MTRFELFTTVHKGIRAALFEAVALAGRTDFGSDAEAARVVEAVRRLLGFLDEHAAHEDAVIVPELAALAPELHAELQAEHARVGGLGHEVGATVDRLAAASGAERLSLGRRLHDRLVRLAADHLVHMQREEQEANRVLWAHHPDEALRALHGRILGAIPPARNAEWLGVILPALSLPERVSVLAPLRGRVPAPALRALTAPAREALGERDWATTAAAAGL